MEGMSRSQGCPQVILDFSFDDTVTGSLVVRLLAYGTLYYGSLGYRDIAFGTRRLVNMQSLTVTFPFISFPRTLESSCH